MLLPLFDPCTCYFTISPCYSFLIDLMYCIFMKLIKLTIIRLLLLKKIEEHNIENTLNKKVIQFVYFDLQMSEMYAHPAVHNCF